MKKMNLLLSILASVILLSGCTNADGRKYSVKTKGGAPFLHVDDKPVRNRLFYSNVPGTKYQYINTSEQTHNIDFVSSLDTKDATISLNFGAVIKDIWISELTLENLTDKTKQSVYDFSATPVDKNLFTNWTVKALEAWRDYSLQFSDVAPDTTLYPTAPYKAENNNSILHIEKAFIDMNDPRNKNTIHDIERLNFCVKNIAFEKGKKYRLTAKLRTNIKGRFEVMVYDTKSLDLIASNTPETFMTTEKYASEVGVDFVTFGVPAFWKDDETCKKLVDSRFEPVIKANPNVKIIVRLGLEPTNEWLDAHPDELMRNADGTPIIRMHVRFPFPGSEVYRRDAINAMKKFIKYVEDKYPNNIAGYHPSGGNSSEWFYPSRGNAFNGHSVAIKKAWKKWLKEKYQTDEALQKAWRNPNATIAGATPPTEKERRNEHFPLINPEANKHVSDFNIFLQDSMSGIVLLAAKTIRECAPHRLSVVFYGYGLGFAGGPRGPAYSGHYAMRKILDSPYVDAVTSPIAYSERHLGGIKCYSVPTESVRLSGKLWIDEDDNRTWLAPESGSPPYVLDFTQTDREKSKMVMRRNMMQEVLKNHGSWWMDLFGCGWFNDRELWNVQNEFKEIENEFIKNPSIYSPEIAVSYDEYSLCQVSAFPYSARISAQMIGQLPRYELLNGTTVGYYLFDDIISGKATPKIHYVSGAYALDKKQRELLRKSEERMTNVYMWSVGYIDKDTDKFSLDAIEQATGFKVEYLGEDKGFAFPTDVLKKFGITEMIGRTFSIPLFSPVLQKGDVVLAKYKNGKPAIVVRYAGKYPQIFCGIPSLSTKLCAYFDKIVGVHSYVDNEAIATANGNYIGINTRKAGTHTLNLKEEAEVFDVLEKKNLGRFKTKTFDLNVGDVKLFKLKK